MDYSWDRQFPKSRILEVYWKFLMLEIYWKLFSILAVSSVLQKMEWASPAPKTTQVLFWSSPALQKLRKTIMKEQKTQQS